MALDPAAVEETFEVLALEVKLGMVHGDRGGWVPGCQVVLIESKIFHISLLTESN